jgi:hypothetical protein
MESDGNGRTINLPLIFLGGAGYIELFMVEVLTLVRQLVEDMLVAAVDMLRVLELLYRVNADVEVPALDMVLAEERQLLDATELALEARGRPLRELLGETFRPDGSEPRIEFSLGAA